MYCVVTCLQTGRHPATWIACHAGHYYHADVFYAAVRYWVRLLQAQPFQRYALSTEDAYPFAALIFVLLHAGLPLSPLNPAETGLVIFTSGSTNRTIQAD
jgi:hypothetical protein